MLLGLKGLTSLPPAQGDVYPMESRLLVGLPGGKVGLGLAAKAGLGKTQPSALRQSRFCIAGGRLAMSCFMNSYI